MLICDQCKTVNLVTVTMATGESNTKKQHRLLQLIECPICLNEMNDSRLFE